MTIGGSSRSAVRALLATTAAAAVVVAISACSGPAPLSGTCKTAMTHEKTVVGGNNQAVAALNVPTVSVPKLWHEDQRAIKAVTVACPSSVKVLLPT